MHRFFDYVWVNVSILTDIARKRNKDWPSILSTSLKKQIIFVKNIPNRLIAIAID